MWKCVCVEVSSSGEFCKEWHCHEFGADYYWPNLLWTLFSAVMSLPFTLLSFYFIPKLFAKKSKVEVVRRMTVFCICNGVWVCAFMVVGMWKAGLMVLIFVFPIHFSPLILFYVYYRRASDEDTHIDLALQPTHLGNKYTQDEGSEEPVARSSKMSFKPPARCSSPTFQDVGDTPSNNSNSVSMYTTQQTSDATSLNKVKFV